jgi:BirA family biotin operon repressor/biotin-[acetyl-CoA-carboxylase] ligase
MKYVFQALTAENILKNLNTRRIGKECYVFQELDSTNDQAKRMANVGADEGMVFVAETQTKGRGRLQRPWASAKGRGLWFSIILRPDILPENAAEIVFMTAVAVCGALKVYTGLSCFLKWPNDILWRSKKLCGILTEMSVTSGKVDYVVVGIGINVNQSRTDFPEEFGAQAASLAMASGTEWDRAPLLHKVLHSMDTTYDDYLTWGFATILNRWKSLCGIFNQHVRIESLGEVIEGTALDVDEQGGLLIGAPSGIQRVTVGDVAVIDHIK